MNSAQSNIREIDLSFSPSLPGSGVYGVMGLTERGELNNPRIIINSWAMFTKYFGGLTNDEFPSQCKKALEAGAKLRVSRLVHYTDLATNTPEPVTATITGTRSWTTTVATFKTGDTAVATINGTPIAAVTFQGTHNNTMVALAQAIVTGFPNLITSALVVPPATAGGNSTVIVFSVKAGATITTFTIVPAGSAALIVFTPTTIATIQNSSSTQILGLIPRGPGTAYNNLIATITRPTDGVLGRFDLTVRLTTDPTNVEVYRNLYILDNDVLATQTGLNELLNSALVTVTLPTTLTGTNLTQRTPQFGAWGYSGGTAGTALTSSDYIGNSANYLGFNSFDKYDDINIITTPALGISDTAVASAGAAYAEFRKDLVFFIHVNNTYTTANAIATARDATLIDSTYVAFYGGGIKALSSITGKEENLSEMGKVLGLASRTHDQWGAWYSYAGSNRGVLTSVTGVVNNFGGPANKADMDLLANKQVNMTIVRNNRAMLWGNFTAQQTTSALSFLSVRFLLLYMKKVIGPYLTDFLEEPNTISTWKSMYYGILPFLEDLQDRKALWEFEWQGDQFASDLSGLTINDPDAVALGKYKIRLYLKPIVSLQEIEMFILLSPAGISFDEASALA